MHPSYQLLMNHVHEGMSDEEFVHNELRLAELAEPLGFSAIWCVEHHFDREYSMCPDNIQLLTYLAARTETIRLKTAAVILPWHDPLRVTEQIAFLDVFSKGRLDLGFGRGLSRSEYAQFGIDMGESRERWHEILDIVLRGLETGVVEGDGKFYKQPPATLIPFTGRDFRENLTEIAMSPESVEVAAELGAAMASFIQFPIDQHKPLLDTYHAAYQKHHGTDGPPPAFVELISCHEDAEEAKRLAHEHCSRYFFELMRHYEFAGNHFKDTKGYQSYAQVQELFATANLEEAAIGYAEANLHGTPEEIVEKIAARREIIGDFHNNCVFSFGGIPFDTAEAGMRLYSEKVMPELRKMGSVGVPA